MNLQFEISDQEIEKLDEMLKETNLDSYKDLLNNSLSLFYWAAQQIKLGKVIAAVDEGAQKYTEAQMSSLQYITDTLKTEVQAEVSATGTDN
jgi:hypothetical protein